MALYILIRFGIIWFKISVNSYQEPVLNTKAHYVIQIILMEHINLWSMLMILILIL